MSQTFDFSFQNPNPQATNEAWLNNQFLSDNDQQLQQPQFGENQFESFSNSSKVKSDVDALEDGELFINNNQQFNDFISNSASAGSHSNNSSDKSSPSTILNNVPFTSSDINFLNNEIQRDEKDLSDKELADRRKAQNRAAQRAFRERKEQKLKELEDKLNKSEFDKATLLQQLEELRKQNVVISTENKLLLQNGNTTVPLGNPNNGNESFSFPSSDYHRSLAQNGRDNAIKISAPSQKNMTITQVWEYLANKNDPNLDVEAIMKDIRNLEVCHEQGPAYPVSVVDTIVAKHS